MMKSSGPNRVSEQLRLLETSDKTLQHVQIQQAISNNKNDLDLLKRVNQAMIGLIAAVALYGLIDGLFLSRRPLVLKNEPVAAPAEGAADVTYDAQAKWNDLKQAMARRSIFEPYASPAQKSVLENEILQRIRIVGVILNANPRAIIEIVNSGETVFVGRGDTVTGAVVTDIVESKVVLMYNGMQLELLR